MRTRARIVTLVCVLGLTAGGCGASETSGGGGGPDPNDKRAVALGCIRDEGLDARPAGQRAIQVNGIGGPRVEFFVTSGEAEGRQFQGGAQGAEHIGSALLFVNDAGDEQLKKIETCLEDQ